MPGETQAGPGFTFDDDSAAAPKPTPSFTFDDDAAPAKAPQSFTYDPAPAKAPASFSFDDEAPAKSTAFTFDDEAAPQPTVQKPVSQMSDAEARAEAEKEYATSIHGDNFDPEHELAKGVVNFGKGIYEGAIVPTAKASVKFARRQLQPLADRIQGVANTPEGLQARSDAAPWNSARQVVSDAALGTANAVEGYLGPVKNPINPTAAESPGGLLTKVGGTVQELGEGLDHFGGAGEPVTPEEAKEAWYQSWRAKQLDQEQKADEAAKSKLPGIIASITGKTPDPDTAQMFSLALDPSMYVPGGLAKLAMLGKTAKAADLAAVAVKGSPLGRALEATGNALSTVGHAPETLAAGVGGDRAASVVAHAMGTGGVVSLATHGIDLSNPFTAILQLFGGAKAVGPLVTKAGEAVSAVSPEIGRVTAQPLFDRVAKNRANAPWVRDAFNKLAGNGTALDTFVTNFSDAMKAGAHGAATNVGIGLATGQSPEEIEQGAGLGFGLAGGMHGISSAMHGDSMRQAADTAAFVLGLQAQGVPEATINAIHPEVAKQMSQMNQVFGGHLFSQDPNASGNVLLLDQAAYDAHPKSVAGAGGFYNADNHQIVINVNAKVGAGQIFLHELGHALYNGPTVNQAQWKAHVDSTLGPQDLEAWTNQYAEKLVRGYNRKAMLDQGLQPTPEEVHKSVTQAQIEAEVARLDAQSGGNNNWIYEELFSEQTQNTLFGKNVRTQVLNSSERDLDRLTGASEPGPLRRSLDAIFPPEISQQVREGRSPTQIFENFPALDGPAGRRMIYEAVRDRNRVLEDLHKGDQGDTGVVLNKEQAAAGNKNNPLHYNEKTGKAENDFFQGDIPDQFNPPKPGEAVKGAINVVEKPKATIGRNDKTRAQEVAANITNARTQDPNAVAPRRQEDGTMRATGTQIAPQLANFQSFSAHVKQTAAQIDSAIAAGDLMHVHYQALASGSEGTTYAKNLKKTKGNKVVTERNVIPYNYSVSNKNNVLVKVLDVTSAQKKAQAWADTGQLSAFNNNAGEFMTALRGVLQNHAQGLAGEASGIGALKKNIVNSFIAGDIKGARDFNPLRAELKGSDRKGIIRDFRLDRIANSEPVQVKPGQEIGGPVSYPKVRKNVSPDISASPDVATGPTHNPQMVELVKKYVPEFDNIHPSFWQQKPTYKGGARKQNQIAREYAGLKTDNLDDPRVMRSYQALSEKVVAQFDDLLKTAKVESWEQPGQPYKNSAEMQHDLIENNHLFYFPTSEGYGQGDGNFAQRHPMLQDSGRKDINGRPMLVNDVFRAVHDAIAHSAFGLQFGPAGEEAAWRVHSATIPDPWARQALTAETRGQNSWVNFQDKHMGPDGPLKKGDQGYVPFAEREFADQKADVLPWRDSLTGDSTVDAPVLQDRELTGRSDLERGAPAGSLPPGSELDHQGTPSTDISQPGQEGAARRFASPDIVGNGWIGPDGKYVANKSGEEHPEAAVRIAGKQTTPGGAYRTLLERGWLRAVREPGSGNLYVDNGSKPLNLTSGQKATLEDHSFTGKKVLHDSKQGAKTVYDAVQPPERDIAASPDQEAQDVNQRINSRRPFGKNAVNEGFDRAPSLEAIKSDPKLVGKIADKIRSYKELRLPGRANDVKTVDQFTNFVKDNILWLHDKMDPGLRERSSKWYDGARKLTEDWSSEFQVPRQAVAGVLAALSPQKDWFMNISMARRVLETMRHHQDTVATPAMAEFGNRIAKVYPDLKPIVDSVAGKKFSELDGDEKALWLRLHDEVTRDRGYRITTPEGEDMGAAKNDSGSDAAAGWGSLNEIGKALKVLADPRREAIETTLGNPHKVRSFYNNIILPNEPTHGDVTVDTHAVAAGLLQPLAAKDAQVVDNFSSPSHAETGSKGLYPIYAEAYRAAAKERGILPRQMQSITWEAVRGLFGETFKTAENKTLVKQLWKDYSSGKASLDETRSKISKLAGGIDAPPWHQPDPDWGVPGDHESAGHGDEFAAEKQGSADEGELHQSGVPGPASEGVGAGTRGAAAAAAADQGRLTAASPDIAATVEKPEFKKWFGKSKVVDADGLPQVLYHGTTQEFSKFSRAKANPESDKGAGFYFTNNPEDMGHNYAGLGPDVTNKIERTAERLDSEAPNGIPRDAALERAKKMHASHEGASMPVFVRMENPVEIGGPRDTFLEYDEHYNHETEQSEGMPTGPLANFIQSVGRQAEKYGDVKYVQPFLEEVYQHAADGGIRASEIQRLSKTQPDFSYLEDNTGRLMSHEVLRQALQDAGYDGIIDHTVNDKFGAGGTRMAGMNSDTVHYIAFKPNQIKSAIGNSGEFSRKDADIRHSPDVQPPAVVGSANPGVSRGYGFPMGTSLDVLKDYDRQVIRSIAGASGRSVRFLDHLGIENTIAQGEGTFDRLEPNITLTLPGSDFHQATAVAALMGDALLQDAIIPVQPHPEGSDFGMVLKRDGKPFSHGELLKIYNDVNPGQDPAKLNFSLTKSKDGLLFLDPAQFSEHPYDAKTQFPAFQEELRPIFEKYGLDAVAHRQNSRYIDHSDYAELSRTLFTPAKDSGAAPAGARGPVGRGERSGLSGAGAGDPARRAIASLYRPIWRTYQNFTQARGFKSANTTAPHERLGVDQPGRVRSGAQPAVQR